MELQKVGHDSVTKQTTTTECYTSTLFHLQTFPSQVMVIPSLKFLCKTLRITPDVFQLLLHKIYNESLLVLPLKYIHNFSQFLLPPPLLPLPEPSLSFTLLVFSLVTLSVFAGPMSCSKHSGQSASFSYLNPAVALQSKSQRQDNGL